MARSAEVVRGALREAAARAGGVAAVGVAGSAALAAVVGVAMAGCAPDVPPPGDASGLAPAAAPAAAPTADAPELAPAAFTCDHGAIVRGPRDRPRLALVFTGGSFAEGADAILEALDERGVRASFFVTGDFIRTPDFHRHLRRIVDDGHYLGPHSDGHLLYAPWDDRDSTLVSRAAFRADLARNLDDLSRFGPARDAMRFFIPPYEWYNRQIAEWTAEMGLVLFNYTPGTRSHADYTPDDHPRFAASADIFDGILRYEADDPDGLNGFLLLLHLGAGPGRTDKMHRLVGPLIDELHRRGYAFVRVDELLGSAAVEARPRPWEAGC